MELRSKIVGMVLSLLVEIWDYVEPKLRELAKENDNPIDDFIVDLISLAMRRLKQEKEER